VITLTASIQADNAPLVVAGVSIIVTKTWGQGHVYRLVGGGIDPLMAGLMVERTTADGKLVRGVQTRDGGLFDGQRALD